MTRGRRTQREVTQHRRGAGAVVALGDLESRRASSRSRIASQRSPAAPTARECVAAGLSRGTDPRTDRGRRSSGLLGALIQVYVLGFGGAQRQACARTDAPGPGRRPPLRATFPGRQDGLGGGRVVRGVPPGTRGRAAVEHLELANLPQLSRRETAGPKQRRHTSSNDTMVGTPARSGTSRQRAITRAASPNSRARARTGQGTGALAVAEGAAMPPPKAVSTLLRHMMRRHRIDIRVPGRR